MSRRTWRRSSKVPRGKPKGNGWVELDSSHRDIARELIETAYPETGRAVEIELERLHDDAKRNWPIKTGKSKESIELVFEVRGDLMRVSLKVGAYYAALIRSKGTRPAFDLVLDQDMTLANRLADRIARTLGD